MIGDTISHYRITQRIGAGGMGVVYKAEDLRLGRAVALKFLPVELTRDEAARGRLEQEARAASALDHPNICTVYEIDETPDGRVFIAMAYYDGETLTQRIARGPLPVEEALEIAVQATRAVSAAHEAGILHRDIKSANIMVTRRGEVKLLDFGVAKLLGDAALTRTGETSGTVGYMAPEQVRGGGADQRSDVWALGVVIHEMLAGRRPFGGEHAVAVIDAIANRDPEPLDAIRSDVPAPLARAVEGALRKSPASRPASARALLDDLERCRLAREATGGGPRAAAQGLLRRAALPLALGALALASAGGWWAVRANRIDSARQRLSRAVTMAAGEQVAPAFRLLRAVEPVLAGTPEFERARKDLLWPTAIRTTPPDADVYVKGYGEVGEEWIHLGRSPIEDGRMPLAYFRWRVTKPGFSTLEVGRQAGASEVAFILTADGGLPEGMVRVAGGPVALPTDTVTLPDFHIDTFEVTNRAFKRFINAGGYAKPEYWQERFVRNGQDVSAEDAMASFRDTTGRPGPAGWELGSYREGEDDHPVGGISWYEAAAYARYAGKQLPTVHHWRRAAAFGVFSDILEHSNFAGTGPSRVGSVPGLGEYGTFDMAGNVREWCRNATGDLRYILGGAWNEPVYRYREAFALSPWDRSASNGLRLVKDSAAASLPEALLRPIPLVARDYSREAPVDDAAFRVYAGLYTYDPTELQATVESTDDSPPHWRVQRVTYAAAYGGERITGYLFLPKHAAPPYQTVVYFPHSGGRYLKRFEQAEMQYLGFIVKAGRALLLPMYQGLYERRRPQAPQGPNAWRDEVIQQVKDLRRSVDYLESRPDIDRTRLAYFGVSLGARLGGVALAVEPRFRAAVLWSGGLPSVARLPEIDEINFLPRVKTPVLMLNGREDLTFPVEASQAPMFRLLGTPEPDKRYVLYEGGHVFPFARIMKDSLDWLDRYLGAPGSR